MQLSVSEIEKIAQLARIEFTGAEKEKLAGELSAVIGYFEKLQKLDTGGVEVEFSEPDLGNVTRKDEAESAENQAAILANAPVSEDGFIKVKSVL